MKLRISFLFVLVCALLFSQHYISAKSSDEEVGVGKASVSITSVVAGNEGALVSWNVREGGNVIGYNVYRETKQGLVQVSPAMVPGRFVSNFVGDDAPFSFFDPSGVAGTIYRIETVEIGSGKRITGAAEAVFDARLKSPLASDGSSGRGLTDSRLKISNAPADHPFSASSQSLLGDFETQKWVAAQPGVKIMVSRDGLVRVTRAALENAGFDVAAPVANWQLYFHGIQQSIIVPADGSYIEFVGKGLDANESTQNVYFLVVGTGAGKRIRSKAVRRLRSPKDTKNFKSRFVRKNNTIYVSTVRNGTDSNFFGEVIASGGATLGFDLAGFDPTSSAAELEVNIQGLTLGAHEVSVVLNGTALDPMSGLNKTAFTKTYQVPAGVLQETGNSLVLTSIGAGSDISILINIAVNYTRKYIAAQDQLAFDTQLYLPTEITGFTGDQIRVFNLTFPESPSEVSNALVTAEGGGGFKAMIPANRKMNMLAVGANAIVDPDEVVANIPSTLSDVANAANYLIITHPDFAAESALWASYRANDGFQSVVIDVTDVFDEFSFGEVTAVAIRSFLEYAENNWQTDPDYVLLMGDASYDPKNIEGQGAFNLMPALLVDTLYEETGSDDSIADFNNDGLAEVAIGRIPARIPSDVTNALAKVTSFESTVASAPARGSLCASDLPSGYDFAGLCDRIHSELPPSIPTSTVNRGDVDAHTNLIAAINSGKYIVNYSGHGAVGFWATGSFFDNGDAALLTNSDLSIFTMLTCLNGYFLRPVNDGLSETLLKRQSGGAVSVWSSSGSTTPDVQEIMARRFFNELGAGPDNRLGDLINDAKASLTGGADVKRSWVLLGDPGLKVKEAAPGKAEYR